MRLLAAAGIALVATFAHASDMELTADEIRARMIGNTIVGTENGEAYAEYLSPSGAIYGRNKHESYNGWWRIAGNKLCFAYEEENGKKPSWNCVFVALTGDKVIWNDDNETSFARLLPGRAERAASTRTSHN